MDDQLTGFIAQTSTDAEKKKAEELRKKRPQIKQATKIINKKDDTLGVSEGAPMG